MNRGDQDLVQANTQEFQYYGEMSFLTPHYSSRQTKSNIKQLALCTPNNESSEFQFVINKPSTSQSTLMGTDLGTVQWNSDLYESVSLCSDDSFLQTSPQQQMSEIYKTDTDADDNVPFSPTAHTILQKFSSKQLPSNKTCTKQKYKQKENSNIKVPKPDKFCKKKRVDLDSYMHSSAKSFEKMAQNVEDILSRKAVGNKENVSDSIDKNSDLIDKDVSDILKCAHIGLKQVRPDKRFECIIEILRY